jgi:hypothetical protein
MVNNHRRGFPPGNVPTLIERRETIALISRKLIVPTNFPPAELRPPGGDVEGDVG